MTVSAVITKLAEIEAGLPGVKHAHDRTPESLAEFPCFINYPLRGTVGAGAGGQQIKGLHTVMCELHVTRQILPEAEGLARPFIDSFPKALWADPTLEGTVNTVLEVRYQYGRLAFGGETHLGVQFEVDFKLQEGIT